VAENEDRPRPLPGLADWEQKLAAIIAYKFERIELEELKAELYKTIIELKARPLSHVQHWEKYLAKALHNRADNWTRRRRDAARSEFVLAEHETLMLSPPKEDDLDDQLGIAQFRRALGPELREVLVVLEKHNFNQAAAAKELGIHRNTLGTRIRKIRQIARAFSLDAHSKERVVRKARRPSEFVILASRFLRTACQIQLSGSAWRVLLWLIRKLSLRKQATMPRSWYGIARELKLDNSSVIRAAHSLDRAGLIFIQDNRIGLRRTADGANRKEISAPADDSRRRLM
jgi:DNA-directed RNA polymerase specialized sigma24 family protein